MGSHSLPVVSRETYAKFQACVHCGLCLPACPTYVETLDEADSPRGRIHLMKAAVDGRIGVSDMVFEHLDRCLVCRSCETACPSGVIYHDLIEAVRPQVAQAALGGGKRLRSGVLQWMIEHTLPYPGRVAASLAPLNLARRMGLGGLVGRLMRLVPGGAAAMEMAPSPDEIAVDEQEFPVFAPRGARRGEVILLRGCVGNVLSAGLHRACARVLSENGFDVHVLAEESCCGALAAHANDPEAACDFAAQMVDALEAHGGDYFVSAIAGCGAQLKALDHVLADSPTYVEKARQIVARMRDITEFLAEVGVRPPPGGRPRSVVYHDPCHLLHAQRIADAPRKLLAMIPGLTVAPLAESDLCCGAAGTYSLNQPEMADRLGRRKVGRIMATGASEVVTANIGCTLQIARHLRRVGAPLPVRHVVELLAESYGATGG